MLHVAAPGCVEGLDFASGDTPRLTWRRVPLAALAPPAVDADGGAERPDRVPEQAIRDQMARIVRSELFAQSDRLNRFLLFTIDAALAGRADTLKEYTIGTKVYDRRCGYAPSADSIVRTEARRLRSKLDQYYASAGQSDPVMISYRPGSYAPQFRHRSPRPEPPEASHDHELEWVGAGAGVGVAVLPFSDLSGTARSGVQARAVAEALAYHLARTDGFRVLGPSPDVAPGGSAVARPAGVQITFDGSVREEANQLGITCRMVNAAGYQIWSQRFECDSDALPAFALAERVAAATVSRIRAEPSLVRPHRPPATPALLSLYPTVLMAEATLDEGRVDDLRVAVSRLEDLVRAAPQYTRPHWAIAQCYHELAHRGVPLTVADVARAGEVATAAVEVNPEASAGRAALASAQALGWDWAGVGESYRRAVALGTHGRACRQYGLFLMAQGRAEPAWHYLNLAQEVDPFSQAQKAAVAKGHYFGRQYADAVRCFARPARFGPLPLTAELLVALSHIQLGETDVALAMASAARARAGSQPTELATVAEVTALGGDVPSARRIVADHGLAGPDVAISGYRRSLLLLALGDDRAALSALARSCESRDVELMWLAVEPRFDRVRGDRRFKTALERVGLGAGPSH